MCRAQLMEEFGGKSKGQRRQRQALLMKRLASKDAMQLAAGHGHLEAVKALAKVNVLEGEVLPGGKAALLSASLHGHADVLEYLILRGAGVHARGDAAMRRASQVKVLVAALHSASQEGHTDVVKLLIQHGADVHARDEQALRWASANGHVNVVELLIQHDADVHACNDAALRSASAKGHADVVQLLMQHGARMPSS
jgi:ankyrin repeat protein